MKLIASRREDLAACGPELSFRMVGPLTWARRGRRCPAGAHAPAVGASHRLHCDARPGVAPPNSLRSLRSLRSNSRGESADEARCACRPQSCASRRRRNRPRRAPPAAQHALWRFEGKPPPLQQRRARAGWSAPLRCREAQGSWPRAQRELCTDSSRLFERSESSERSEFGDGAARPSIGGESTRSGDRRGEARNPARARLCRPDAPSPGRRRTSAQSRLLSLMTPWLSMRCESRKTRPGR